ncbi:hypothetical protein OL548_03190 [Lysinibacillus sp. MHQ-1]|nr:hypothetical protein OL548_03190 [Lysinibacillus sp. MHQ-1]
MLLRSIILFIPTLILLPKVFGSQAIWWTFPVAEGITALLIYGYIKKKSTNNCLSWRCLNEKGPCH